MNSQNKKLLEKHRALQGKDIAPVLLDTIRQRREAKKARTILRVSFLIFGIGAGAFVLEAHLVACLCFGIVIGLTR